MSTEIITVPTDGNQEVRLVVGKIELGATEDKLLLYLPDTDLILPAEPASIVTGDLDNSDLDVFRFEVSNGNTLTVDEIRIGTTYDSVGGYINPNWPDVDAGVNMITVQGLKVELDPTIVEAPGSNWTSLTYLWTADPCDGVVFDPPIANVEEPNVTITKPLSITTEVEIVNPGFEEPALNDGDFRSDFEDCPGWSDVDVISGGVWDPGLVGYTGYGGSAPEGENIAYVTGSGIKQVLTETVAADTTYTLSVKVCNNVGTLVGYKVQFLADGNLLDEDDSTLTIASDANETSTVTYASGADAVADPNVGLALQIRLLNGASGEANFDDVKLTAEAPAPDPYIVKLTLAVSNAGNPPDEAVRDTMTIDVYDDACVAAKAALVELGPGNFDGNCIKDFRDFAVLLSTWVVDYTSAGPIPK